jgi:hypothetical protein
MLTNQIAQGLSPHHFSIDSLLKKRRCLKHGNTLDMIKFWGARKFT